MASWSRRERTVTDIEFVVPVWADHGAAVGEVFKALRAAEMAASELGKRTDCDDWAWVTWDDENVVIRVRAASSVVTQ
jgi:hypothetical protein